MYYQARLKLSLSPEHSLLFSLFHSSVCQDCILPMKHGWRRGQEGSFWNSYSHRSHAGRDGLWIKHWPLVRKLADLEEKKREQEAMVRPTYHLHGYRWYIMGQPMDEPWAQWVRKTFTIRALGPLPWDVCKPSKQRWAVMINYFFQECEEQNRSLLPPFPYTLLAPCSQASCPLLEPCLPVIATLLNGSYFPCLHLLYTNHQCLHSLVQWESTSLFIWGVCFLSQPPTLPDFPWMLSAWKVDLGLSFDFLPSFPSAQPQSSSPDEEVLCVDLRWKYLPLPNCLFQNSSYSAVAKQNEKLLWGPGMKSKRDRWM